MTGAVQAGTCARCLDHEGPFPFCVVNPHRGSCNQCANCWWVAGHRKRAGRSTPSPRRPEGSPEYWAHRAGNAPWGRCHNAAKSKNSLLERTMAMPLLREPKLQLNSKNNKRKIVDGQSFNSQLGQSLHAAEALLAHSVGEKLPAEGACLSCQKRDGKFVSCVKVPGKDHCQSCFFESSLGTRN
ncbi:hypothetical protein N7452_007878 [Penicillium brevicompactum]|uniref:Uncharacterized protein n=1 Tax=Penicillium brevicompactum TaxID=5074 RepID=A0A9W9QLQ5_PENBR|nr:hypothetical protein N7452_007878 [Penicillium brevicompactum]